jgi:hypothetical protein
MEKGECSSSILSRLDLDDIEEIVWEPHHKYGPGRPPRNPLGIFKAEKSGESQIHNPTRMVNKN